MIHESKAPAEMSRANTRLEAQKKHFDGLIAELRNAPGDEVGVVGPGEQTLRGVRVSLHRAARRAGVVARMWERDGQIYVKVMLRTAERKAATGLRKQKREPE